EVLVVADVAAALEHEVLEQVREAAAARVLAPAADVVDDVDRHDRVGVVLVDHDLQPVVEHVLLEGQLDVLGGDGGGHEEQRGEGRADHGGLRGARITGGGAYHDARGGRTRHALRRGGRGAEPAALIPRCPGSCPRKRTSSSSSSAPPATRTRAPACS